MMYKTKRSIVDNFVAEDHRLYREELAALRAALAVVDACQAQTRLGPIAVRTFCVVCWHPISDGEEHATDCPVAKFNAIVEDDRETAP